jgi:hypothetical protein
MVGLLGRVDEWSARRKASTYTGQHNTERQVTNIHALSGIRNHDPSNQPAKTHASDRTATVTGEWMNFTAEICITTKFSNYSKPLNGLTQSLKTDTSAVAVRSGVVSWFTWFESQTNLKMAVFWVAALCSLVEVYRRFRRYLLPPSSGRWDSLPW